MFDVVFLNAFATWARDYAYVVCVWSFFTDPSQTKQITLFNDEITVHDPVWSVFENNIRELGIVKLIGAQFQNACT